MVNLEESPSPQPGHSASDDLPQALKDSLLLFEPLQWMTSEPEVFLSSVENTWDNRWQQLVKRRKGKLGREMNRWLDKF